MKRGILILICVFLGVALGMVVLMVLAIRGGSSSFFGSGTSMRNNSTAQLVKTQTFPAEISSIDIGYTSDRISLEKSTTGSIVFEEYMTSWDDSMLAQVNETGGSLRIRQGQRPPILHMWAGYAVLYLPEDWSGELTATNSSGSIRTEESFRLQSLYAKSTSGSVRLGNIQASGPVSIESSSGSVSAGTITAEGAVTLRSTSGSVRADEIKGDTVSARSSSGSVRLGGAHGNTVDVQSNSGSISLEELTGTFSLTCTSGGISADNVRGQGQAVSSSGSVRMGLKSATGDISLSSTSGSVRVSIPKGDSFTFQAQTTSGSIRTDFDNSLSFNSRKNQASGTVGSSPAYHLECKTSSGSVQVSQ